MCVNKRCKIAFEFSLATSETDLRSRCSFSLQRTTLKETNFFSVFVFIEQALETFGAEPREGEDVECASMRFAAVRNLARIVGKKMGLIVEVELLFDLWFDVK